MAGSPAWRLVAVALLGALAFPAAAHADRDFALRRTGNAQCDIALVGNTILSCVSTEPACPAARDGTITPVIGANNTARSMTYVDVDANPVTFNSSSATFGPPSGGRVFFAGLYWAARLEAGKGGAPAPNPAANDRVLFGVPGGGAYLTVTASVVDTVAARTRRSRT